MSEHKIISVITPVYNSEKFLSQCIESLLGQTYSHWEAIFVNDGSKDNSLKILQNYAAKDKRIIVIDKENEGVSAARNDALQKAKGDYITFLDSDDMFFPQFMEYMLSTIEKFDVDMVWCRKTNCSEDLLFDRNSSYSGIKKVKIFSDPLNHYFMRKSPKITTSVWAKLYKKEVLNGLQFDTNMKISAEDGLYLSLALDKMNKFAFIQNKLLHYRNNSSSLTHKKISYQYVDDQIYWGKNLLMRFQNNKNIKKVATRIIFRTVCSVPYFSKDLDYQAYWQHYLPTLQELHKENILSSKNMSLFNKLLFRKYISGNFKSLKFWLNIYKHLKKAKS